MDDNTKAVIFVGIVSFIFVAWLLVRYWSQPSQSEESCSVESHLDAWDWLFETLDEAEEERQELRDRLAGELWQNRRQRRQIASFYDTCAACPAAKVNVWPEDE